MGALAADVDVALAGIQFPLEHRAEVLGDFEDERAAQSRVLAVAFAALILIYLLLQSAFSSWRLATLGFLALPMGISGAFIAVAVTGGEMTLGSVAGIVAIFGLATRGVVLLVRSYQRRQRLGEEFGEDLIVSETAALVVPTTISILAIAVGTAVALSVGALRVENGDMMQLKVISRDCSVSFDDVLVRADEAAKLEVHIDTDEGNACNLDVATTIILKKDGCGCKS